MTTVSNQILPSRAELETRTMQAVRKSKAPFGTLGYYSNHSNTVDCVAGTTPGTNTSNTSVSASLHDKRVTDKLPSGKTIMVGPNMKTDLRAEYNLVHNHDVSVSVSSTRADSKENNSTCSVREDSLAAISRKNLGTRMQNHSNLTKSLKSSYYNKDGFNVHCGGRTPAVRKRDDLKKSNAVCNTGGDDSGNARSRKASQSQRKVGFSDVVRTVSTGRTRSTRETSRKNSVEKVNHVCHASTTTSTVVSVPEKAGSSQLLTDLQNQISQLLCQVNELKAENDYLVHEKEAADVLIAQQKSELDGKVSEIKQYRREIINLNMEKEAWANEIKSWEEPTFEQIYGISEHSSEGAILKKNLWEFKPEGYQFKPFKRSSCVADSPALSVASSCLSDDELDGSFLSDPIYIN